jgi:hypothetical protein
LADIQYQFFARSKKYSRYVKSNSEKKTSLRDMLCVHIINWLGGNSDSGGGGKAAETGGKVNGIGGSTAGEQAFDDSCGLPTGEGGIEEAVGGGVDAAKGGDRDRVGLGGGRGGG